MGLCLLNLAAFTDNCDPPAPADDHPYKRWMDRCPNHGKMMPTTKQLMIVYANSQPTRLLFN